MTIKRVKGKTNLIVSKAHDSMLIHRTTLPEELKAYCENEDESEDD